MLIERRIPRLPLIQRLLGQSPVELNLGSNVWVSPGYADRAAKISTTDLREVYASLINEDGKATLIETEPIRRSAWRQRVNERLNAFATKAAIKYTRFMEGDAIMAGFIADIPTGFAAVAVVARLHVPQEAEAVIVFGTLALGYMGGRELFKECSRLANRSSTEGIIPSTD